MSASKSVRWGGTRWQRENTGGNCTAYVRRHDGREYYITAETDPRTPEIGESYLVTCMDSDGDIVAVTRYTAWPYWTERGTIIR